MSNSAQVAGLGPREAAKAALAWVRDLYEATEPIRDVGLEELELVDSAWRVTVGFSRPWSRQLEKSSELAALTPFAPPTPVARDYKVVKVDAETGAVLGMEMREL